MILTLSNLVFIMFAVLLVGRAHETASLFVRV